MIEELERALQASGLQYALAVVDASGASHLRHSPPTFLLHQAVSCLRYELDEAGSDLPLGEVARRCRVARHQDVVSVAARIGVSRHTVSRWEATGRVPAQHVAAALAYIGPTPPVDETEREPLGRRLWRARTEAGWSRAALARALAVDPSTVWRWERDHDAPTAENLQRLTAILAAGGAP